MSYPNLLVVFFFGDDCLLYRSTYAIILAVESESKIILIGSSHLEYGLLLCTISSSGAFSKTWKGYVATQNVDRLYTGSHLLTALLYTKCGLVVLQV